MLSTLLSVALANSPVTASYEVMEQNGRKRVESSVQLGLDMTGWRPGLGARVSIGHRVAVEGRMVAGVPLADDVSWSGGASLGLSVAPLRLQLGSAGDLSWNVGAGGLLDTRMGGALDRGEKNWDLGGWLSSTLEVSPDGRWHLFGGLMAQDVLSEPAIVPTVGVRMNLR